MEEKIIVEVAFKLEKKLDYYEKILMKSGLSGFMSSFKTHFLHNC